MTVMAALSTSAHQPTRVALDPNATRAGLIKATRQFGGQLYACGVAKSYIERANMQCACKVQNRVHPDARDHGRDTPYKAEPSPGDRPVAPGRMSTASARMSVALAHSKRRPTRKMQNWLSGY